MTSNEAGVSLVAREDINWRKDIISQLRERNRSQTYCFADLISLHNRLFESANTMRNTNMQLTIANETLRREAANGSIGIGGNPDLEARLLKQAEELAMLHKRKGEHTQQIVDLNNKLQESTKELQAKEASLAESLEANANLRLEITKCLGREKEIESINQMLKDEHQALQLAFASLEEKLRKTQEENRQLIERLIKYKARDAEKMNEENDNFLRKKQAKMQKELEDAARDTRPVSPDRLSLKEVAGLPTAVPTKVSVTFSAHEGEVYAVKWSPTDRILATGGADRKVKLWNITKGTSESKGILVGSNAGVMSVDFDSTGTLILGASNDYASRVWTVSDLRLKINLRTTIPPFCIVSIQPRHEAKRGQVVTEGPPFLPTVFKGRLSARIFFDYPLRRSFMSKRSVTVRGSLPDTDVFGTRKRFSLSRIRVHGNATYAECVRKIVVQNITHTMRANT